MKEVTKSVAKSVLGNQMWRRIVTSNFGSGRLVIGEANHRLFPIRWVTLNWNDADISCILQPDTRLPFADASQDVIYSAHTLEHLDDATLLQILRETRRILRPGGLVRFEVPDAEFLLRSYVEQNEDVLSYFRDFRRKELVETRGFGREYLEDHLTVLGEIANYIVDPADTVHIPVYATREEFDKRIALPLDELNAWAQSLKTPSQRTSGGHSNALSFSKIRRLMEEQGFRDVVRVGLGSTTDPRLHLGAGIRRFWSSIPEKSHRSFYSLYVEGRTPQ